MPLDFQRIVIVGLGLIGGSIAAALKRANVTASIAAVDSRDTLAVGTRRGIVDEGYGIEDLAKAVAGADLILLATPVRTILELLGTLGDMAAPGTLITDVGSTKAEIVEQARRHLPENRYFIGGHPMAGSESGGVEQADPTLLDGAAYVLTEKGDAPPEVLEKLLGLIQRLNAEPIFMSAERHDEIVAATSHVPHLLAVTLLNCVANRTTNQPETLKLIAGGFRDMTRVASGPADIWQDILASNTENIRQTIDAFISELSQMRDRLDEEECMQTFQKAAEFRRRLL